MPIDRGFRRILLFETPADKGNSKRWETLVNDIKGNELEVVSGDKRYSGNVVIPEEVTYMNKVRKVTRIGFEAFYKCSSLTSVTIPNSVSSIGWHAFEGCSGLTSITIPNSVTSIGSSAFSGCSGLTSVTIPNNVKSIGDHIFSYCSGLSSITIPNSVTNIGDYAFFCCSGLISASIPNSVKSIGDQAFFACSGLKSVAIGNSVASIGSEAFSYCGSIVSISVASGNTIYDSRNNCNAIIETSTNTLILGCKNTIIPNSVTSMGKSVFAGCSGLTSITIPNSVTNIGDWAFTKCSGLTSVIIPNSVTSIGKGVFSSCTSLGFITVELNNLIYDSRDNCNAIIETATNTLVSGCKKTIIPNNVRSIGINAFSGHSGLTSITIPNSVTSIGKSAFSGCSSLISVTMPKNLMSIDQYAFNDCSSLTSVTIPNIVTSIGDWAFSGCSRLTNVIVKIKTPVEIDRHTFSGSWWATLYVPSGCKAAYEAANYWKEFKEIVEAVEVTDISKMNHAIYVEPSSARKNDDVSIKVCLKNANAATSYGFELVLPQGLSIAATSEGDFDDAVTMSTRHKDHTLTTNKLADDTYKVGVASLSSKALEDNDGLVLTIKAHVANYMAVGNYPILIQNPLIVNTDGTKPAVQNTLSMITIEDYKKGDVDGDGVVDLADAVLVINHYVGKPVNKFVAKAADVDGDGVIDLADAVRIINFYVGKVQSLAPSINIDRLDPQ